MCPGNWRVGIRAAALDRAAPAEAAWRLVGWVGAGHRQPGRNGTSGPQAALERVRKPLGVQALSDAITSEPAVGLAEQPRDLGRRHGAHGVGQGVDVTGAHVHYPSAASTVASAMPMPARTAAPSSAVIARIWKSRIWYAAFYAALPGSRNTRTRPVATPTR